MVVNLWIQYECALYKWMNSIKSTPEETTKLNRLYNICKNDDEHKAIMKWDVARKERMKLRDKYIKNNG
jgi:hypothetical protein